MSTKKIQMNTENAISAAIKSLEAIKTDVAALCDALNESTVKVEQLIPYPCEKITSGYYPFNQADFIIDHELIKNSWRNSDEIHENNLVIIESNRKILNKILMFIENAGIPSTMRKNIGTNYRPKWTTVDCDWKMAFTQNVSIVDTFEAIKRNYENCVVAWDRELKRRTDKADLEARIDQVKLKQAVELEIVKRDFADKYGVCGTDTIDELIGRVITKNKYLRLGHYLQKNCQDSSNGFDFAWTGLTYFTRDSTIDNEIYNDVSGYLCDDESDGRVFRYATWGYDELFDLAKKGDPEIFADYQRLIKIKEGF